MEPKLLKIKNILKEKKLNAILLINTSLNKLDPNIFYLTGKTFEYCAILITKKNSFLIVPELEYGRAKEIKNGFKLKLLKHRNITELLKILKIRGKVGINFKFITLSESKQLKKLKCAFKDISSNLTNARAEKTEEEIKNIKISCNYADSIMQKLFSNLNSKNTRKKFRTELDILNFLENETQRLKLKTSFKPIVASGKNASHPHHDSKDKIRKGFCVIDFGVKYKGYCSDITRTIYFGKPPAEDIKLYNLVLNTNIESINFVKEKRRCACSYKNSCKLLGKYEKYFIHGLGHGIGVEIHEIPNLSPFSKDSFRKNMVFTIEPGIYLHEKLGIRIEDDIILKEGNKKEILTKTSKRLMCFKI